MAVTIEHFTGMRATVKGVSATKPYDLDVKLAAGQLCVEVKGTTGIGGEILLTRGEVEHHHQRGGASPPKIRGNYLAIQAV